VFNFIELGENVVQRFLEIVVVVSANYLRVGLGCTLTFGCVGLCGFDDVEDKLEVLFGVLFANLG